MDTNEMNSARVAEQIAGWIRDQVEGAGSWGVVLGLSGGIDSAVAAGLCRRVLGDNVLGVLLPCHSLPQDRLDALEVAQVLGLETVEIVLDSVYDSLLPVLPPGDDLARANLKPRLRMLTLYYIANSRNALVIGTGNKVEIQVGYYTKFGDGAADLLPLGDLDKREVRQLAAYLGIPQRVIDKPPSAGLWAGQTDEAEMGLSYDQLDAAIAVLEGDARVQVDPEVLDRVRGMQASSAHKRVMPPVCYVYNRSE